MIKDDSHIDEFLKKLDLSKYRDKFAKEGPLYVERIGELTRFLQEPNTLREAGMTIFEKNRFIRLCEETIKEIMVANINNTEIHSDEGVTNHDCSTSNFHTITASEIGEVKRIRIRYKLLTQDSILTNDPMATTIDMSILYYQLVDLIYSSIDSKIRGMKFQSVELYSNTGYPLAINPEMYLQPISKWFLEQNELILVYPKVLYGFFHFREVTSIKVLIENINLNMQVPVPDWKLFFCDFKMIISTRLHLCINTMIVKLFEAKTRNQINLCDRYLIDIESIQQDTIKVSIQILDNWGDDSYLSAFDSNLYTSCIEQRMIDWHNFNALLLFLAKEQSEISRDKLLEELGLIRKLSCSPPLVYALYRLFTGLQIVLPHRVAINEGILTSLLLLLPNEEKPEIHRFCELWMYVENNASLKYKKTEIYENNFISKRGRENPKDNNTKKLLHVFPDSESTIVIWKDCPSTHGRFNYCTLLNFNIPQDQINQRFPLEHPIEVYYRYSNTGIKYGLIRPILFDMSSPTVFLGPTLGRYGNFNFFSPEEGMVKSYNPHDIISSLRCRVEPAKSSSKLIIVLDISADMSIGSQEYKKGRDPNEQNLILSYLDMAMALIELLIDSITGLGCQYFVGIVLISNDHFFSSCGYLDFQDPILEYAFILERLKKFIEENRPQKHLFRRPSEGIILSCLQHLLDKYPPDQAIYIFTTHDTNRKYYGTRMSGTQARLKQKNFRTNFIILSEGASRTLQSVGKDLHGIYVDNIIITSNRPYQHSAHFPSTLDEISSHYLIEYFSYIQDRRYLDKNRLNNSTYERISSKFKKALFAIETILDRTQVEKGKYQCSQLPNMIHILKQISNYSKDPNPFCKLFSVGNQIQNLISIIQGPDNTPYANSILFLEIRFGKYFPQKPPTFRFLSSYYHPNIRVSGEICHPILFEDYHPGVTLRQIMDSIYGMLYTPVISHAVRYKVLEIALFHKDFYTKLVTSFIKDYDFDTAMSESLKCLNIDESFKKSHPEPYICPLTKELFDLPMMTPEGYTYERHAILQHLKFSQTDPVTNMPLTESDLIPNNPVMSAVYKYRKKFCSKNYWWD